MRIIYNPAEMMSSSKLFSDYVSSPEKVSEFYPTHFGDDLSLRKVMDGISGQQRDHHSELIKILRRQNLAMDSGQLAMENIGKLESDSAFAIVTGQQVGILTGPLYTIYKAMTAIKLAQHLSDKYDARFVPIFWVEANDNDMEEANHINLLDPDSNLLKLEYMPEKYIPGCSMKDVPIDNRFRDLILELEAYFPDTEFKSDMFDIAKGAYLTSQNMGHGFGRMIAKLLGKYGLVLLDPSDPEAKSLMAPMFMQSIISPLEPMEIVNSAGEKIRAKGYESMIEKSSDSTCLFVEDDAVRRKIFFRDGRFIVDGSNEALDRQEMLAILQSDPWRFSPNVALRPVIQDYLLPTFAYVAGPGETSYFAQLGELYRLLDVNMPIIYPRASFTVIENKVARVMEKNDLTISDLSENHERLFSQISKRAATEQLEQLLESSKRDINDIFGELSTELAEFDSGLKNIVESTKKKVDHQINILEQRAYKAQRSRDDILRSQIKRACMNVYPDSKPQERIFNVMQYLAFYGLQFLDNVMSSIEIG